MNDSIVYMPHCSRCGTMLHGEVSVQEVKLKIKECGGDSIGFTNPHYEFSPAVCPKCGANFTTIIYPAHIKEGMFRLNMDDMIRDNAEWWST